MENITATFRSWTDIEQVSAALREQGAINIHVESDGTASYSSSDSLGLEASLQQGLTASQPDWNGEEPSYTLQVIVESSRSRQAADTIARYGGQP